MPETTLGVDLSDSIVRVVVVNDTGQVLARAVKWFVEHRILQNGDKTVVFK